MEGWQRRTREDREFLSCRFQEARALVERLAEENHSLRSLVNGPMSSSSSCSQTEDLQGPPLRKGPADGAQVSPANVPPVENDSTKGLIGSSLQTLDQRDGKRMEEADQCTQTVPPRSLVRWRDGPPPGARLRWAETFDPDSRGKSNPGKQEDVFTHLPDLIGNLDGNVKFIHPKSAPASTSLQQPPTASNSLHVASFASFPCCCSAFSVIPAPEAEQP